MDSLDSEINKPTNSYNTRGGVNQKYMLESVGGKFDRHIDHTRYADVTEEVLEIEEGSAE